jgi:hypothetical protein
MQRLQAFKYELLPNGEQQRDMRRFAGSCRFVLNKALVLQKKEARCRKQVHRLCGNGETPDGMAQRHGNTVAQGRALPPGCNML